MKSFMITDTVQRKSCYIYATPGHTNCKARDEVKADVVKNVIICFRMLTSSAFVLAKGKPKE